MNIPDNRRLSKFDDSAVIYVVIPRECQYRDTQPSNCNLRLLSTNEWITVTVTQTNDEAMIAI